MILNYVINSDVVAEELAAKGDLLEAALVETVGTLGTQLKELAQSKIAPVIRTAIGQGIFDSIEQQAAAFVDGVCSTSVGIDNNGQPSYIVAYVREFGHKAYEIYPLETILSEAGGVAIGAGIKSPFSDQSRGAWGESRLPHSLAWSEGGEVVFAMHVHEPAWEGIPFLRSSLDEMREQVRAAIGTTIAAVLAA